MSGAFEKPRPGDSRYPAEHPRPAGGLLGPLPEGLVLDEEHLAIRCETPGGCQVTHRFVLHNPGPARTVTLWVLTPVLSIHATVDGTRLEWEPPRDDAGAEKPSQRTWRSGGRAVAPGRTQTFVLPGRTQERPLARRRLSVSFGAGGRRTLALVSQSVAGFDRTSRPRTQAEVAFTGTRRRDYFTYHHELRLRDPEGRPRPGGAAGHITLEVDLPRDLEVGADVPLRCAKRAARRRCHGQLAPDRERLLLALAAPYKRPVGLFAQVGLGATKDGVEAWLRAGASLFLRRHLDLLTLTGETDAQHRFGLGLAYQLFLPYTPNTHEMGAHFELGLVLDVWPEVRPALRLGGAFHFGFIQLGALLDFYPGELGKRATGPPWRFLFGAGLGM